MKKALLLLIVMASLTKQTQAQIITTVAGSGTSGSTGSFGGDGGQATIALLDQPQGVTVDAAGNLYITDSWNNRIRKVSTSGIISTVVGSGATGAGYGGYSGDGGLATNAQLDIPQGTTFDAMGNLYIADQGSARIRKVNTVGIITTIAGGGSSLGDGGPATAAGVSTFGVAIDALGNLYIADAAQNRIRRVNTAGIINTIAGNGTAGNIGDGGICTAAELNYPTGVAFDPEGNLYIADSYNNRIRKVTTLGIISTVAGNSTSGYTGDGGQATAAELNQPTVITFDAAGNLFIADMFNGVIRKVNSMGIISTVAGVGTNGFTGDGGQATAAKLDDPSGVAFDSFGNLYIADTGNNRIRKVPNIGQAAGIEQFVTNKEGVNIYPNPTAGILNVACLMPNENSTLVMCDMLGNVVKQTTFNTQHTTLNTNDIEAGVYFITFTSGTSVSTQKVVVSK